MNAMMQEPKLDLVELNRLWVEWKISNKQERFGQYVMNRSEAIPRDDSEVWEAKPGNAAFNLIAAKYIVYDE